MSRASSPTKKQKLVSFEVEEFYLPFGSVELVAPTYSNKKRIRLRGFQEEYLLRVSEFLRREGAATKFFEVVAPPGSGKTLLMFLAAAANWISGAMEVTRISGVYPSKALARDQLDNLSSSLSLLGREEQPGDDVLRELQSTGALRMYTLGGLEIIRGGEIMARLGRRETGVKVVLLLLTSDTMAKAKEVLKERTSLGALKELSRRLSHTILFTFTVPEYPFLLAEEKLEDFSRAGEELVEIIDMTKNSNSPEDLIRKYRTSKKSKSRTLKEHPRPWYAVVRDTFTLLFKGHMFLDEYHLYQGFSEAAAEALLTIYALECFISRKKCIVTLSSATPPLGGIAGIVGRALEHVGVEVEQINAGGISSRSGEKGLEPGGSLVRYRTKVYLHLVDVRSWGDLQAHLLEDFKRDLQRISEHIKNGGKAGVIVNRAYYVAQACREASAAGLSPVAVWGIKGGGFTGCREVGGESMRGASLIIGDTAVAFGVDVPGLSLGYVHASSSPEALQKISRFGRASLGIGAGAEAEVHIYSDYSYELYELRRYEGKAVSYQDLPEILDMIYPRPAEVPYTSLGIYFLKLVSPVLSYIYSAAQDLSVQGEEELVKAAEALYALDLKAKIDSAWSSLKHIRSSEAVFRALSFRGGSEVEIPLCCSDEKRPKQGQPVRGDLLAVLRNFEVDFRVPCIRGEAKSTPMIRIPPTEKDKIVKLHGTVWELERLSRYIKYMVLEQRSGLRQKGAKTGDYTTVEELVSSLRIGVQPVLVLAKDPWINPKIAWYLASTGQAIPVALEGDKENKIIALLEIL